MVKVLSLSLLISLFCVTSVHLINETDEIFDGKLNRMHSFEQWQIIYGKSYTSDEEKLRRKIFHEGTAAVIEHNKRYKNGEVSYFLGQNQFSDLTHDEFKQRMINPSFKDLNFTKVETSAKSRVKRQTLPTSIDYRSRGAVTAVQDQGECGSCYAFAATGAVESQIVLNGGPLTKLSDQEIVDCSGNEGNFACDGGLAENAFQHMIDIGALYSSLVYPYESGSTESAGSCYMPAMKSQFRVVSYVYVDSGDSALQSALVNNGPVTVALNVGSSYSFQFYAGGVWSDSDCSNDPYDLDHAMLLIGYAKTSSNEEYWIVKNSWSTSWGNSGFVRIRKGVNQCGIASWSTYPIVSGF